MDGSRLISINMNGDMQFERCGNMCFHLPQLHRRVVAEPALGVGERYQISEGTGTLGVILIIAQLGLVLGIVGG